MILILLLRMPILAKTLQELSFFRQFNVLNLFFFFLGLSSQNCSCKKQKSAKKKEKSVFTEGWAFVKWGIIIRNQSKGGWSLHNTKCLQLYMNPFLSIR